MIKVSSKLKFLKFFVFNLILVNKSKTLNATLRRQCLSKTILSLKNYISYRFATKLSDLFSTFCFKIHCYFIKIMTKNVLNRQ